MNRLIVILFATFLVGCKDYKKRESKLGIVSSSVDSLRKDSCINLGNSFKENRTFDTLILVDKGHTLGDFIPKSWELFSSDSGKLSPFEDSVLIAAYNTQIPSKERGYSLRCLVIFEKINKELILRKQFFNALDSFDDKTKNWYHTIRIVNKSIEINYREYPRYGGLFSFEYEQNKEDWILKYEEYSSQGTYPIYFQSFDFKTKQLKLEVRSDDKEIDTLIHVKKYLPDVYLSGFKNIDKFKNSLKVKEYGDVTY